MEFLDWTLYDNSIRAWVIAILIAVATFAVLEIVKGLAGRRLAALARRTGTRLDDLVSAVAGKTKGPLLAIFAIYFASRFVYLSDTLADGLGHVAVIALFIQAAIWCATALDRLLQRYVDRQLAEDPATATTIRFLGFIGRIAVWTTAALLALGNLDIEITPLLTTLGVGGIAVALAVQNVLGDLFASLSILLDKPFVIGDFITVGDMAGTVEHVGLKTTRVRSLAGEQIVFSNNDLLQSRIRNYKRMYERRVVFTIGVTYETPYDTLKRIPGMLREVVEAQEKTRFDRAHFFRYGDFSLDFEVVYYVLAPDYGLYMDIQQAINLELFRRFEDAGIEFAYPTQTLFVRRRGAETQVGTETQVAAGAGE